MNVNEAIAKLKINQNDRDIENSHCEADEILCEFLISLGYQSVVDEYNKVPKWYA